MAQPAIFPTSSDLAPLVAENVFRMPAGHQLEGPANQLLSELTLALSTDGDDIEKWSVPASLRLIFAVCGLFWLTAGALAYLFH